MFEDLAKKREKPSNDNQSSKFSEGFERTGGLNAGPTTPKPNMQPKPQKPTSPNISRQTKNDSTTKQDKTK